MTRIIFGRVNIRSTRIPHALGYPYAALKRQSKEHRWAFESLMVHLKENDISQHSSLGDQPPAVQLVKPVSVICPYSSHRDLFALNGLSRGVAMSVADDISPRAVADKVQTTLRETAAAAGIGKDVRVDVDLICSPRRFMRGIKELEQVKRITVTFKLPNSGCTYSDEIGKMLGVGSVKLTQTQENDEGLITSNKALRNIAPGIENGDTELTAESVKGDVWSSQDHPEEYNAETKDADPSLLPLLLLLALAWLHDNWPWRGWAGDS